MDSSKTEILYENTLVYDCNLILLIFLYLLQFTFALTSLRPVTYDSTSFVSWYFCHIYLGYSNMS